MMKPYKTPELEVLLLGADVITTSTDDNDTDY